MIGNLGVESDSMKKLNNLQAQMWINKKLVIISPMKRLSHGTFQWEQWIEPSSLHGGPFVKSESVHSTLENV